MSEYLTFEEAKKLHGETVSCEINGVIIDDAKLSVEGNQIYICHNGRSKHGSDARDKLGYKYSWVSGNNDWIDISRVTLKTKQKGTTIMKYATIINDRATFFETEEEANKQLRENLAVGNTGYLALNIQKVEAIKKFKTTNLNKKKPGRPVKSVKRKPGRPSKTK